MEVFGRGSDFDPSQDSMVRVYAHNLRQKLEHFYATSGRNEPRQLGLARGEYRISLAAAEEAAETSVAPPAVAPDLACRRPSGARARRRALASRGRRRGVARARHCARRRHHAATRAGSAGGDRRRALADLGRHARRRLADSARRRRLLHLRRARRARRRDAPGARLQRRLEQGARRAHDERLEPAVALLGSRSHLLADRQRVRVARRAARALYVRQARARGVDVGDERSRPEVEPRRSTSAT